MSTIETYVELDGETRQVGTAYVSVRRGRTSSTFSYEQAYLTRPGSYAIDPSSALSAGSWASPAGLPRALADAAPDRWGRNLIAKRQRAEAAAGTVPPQLHEDDYLLGVSDVTRQGALRFRRLGVSEFQHPGTDVPKLLSLPALRQAADAVARDAGDGEAAVKALLDAGTGSLGGARPKASVRDDDRLLIAKFDHPGDDWDVMAWEKTVLDLAAAAGIGVPGRRLVRVDAHSVLLLDRFDRHGDRRVGYVSAMTMLEAGEGDSRDYLELAEVIPEHSADTSADLGELWRRVLFSVVIHNTDDHLRNHGFLRHRSGWRLSPLFDVNPNPDQHAQRVTSIAGAAGPREEVAALLAYAGTFGLSDQQARATLAAVSTAVGGWADVAHRNGIRDVELRRFAPLFAAGLAALAV